MITIPSEVSFVDGIYIFYNQQVSEEKRALQLLLYNDLNKAQTRITLQPGNYLALPSFSRQPYD